MWKRASTFLVWALAAASIVYWGLKLFAASNPPPGNVQLATAGPAPRGDLTRLLGADPLPEPSPEVVRAAPDPRFQLVGVVSPRSPRAAREGLAVIVVDDKPARAYRIGAVVEGETVLQSVNPRGASLGPRGGAAVVALDLPPPAAAATGQLPPPLGQPGQPWNGRGAALPGMPAVPPQPVYPAPRYQQGQAVPYQNPQFPTQAQPQLQPQLQMPPQMRMQIQPQPQPQPPMPSQLPGRATAAPTMSPQPNLPTDPATGAPVVPLGPGQQGFDRSGAPLR